MIDHGDENNPLKEDTDKIYKQQNIQVYILNKTTGKPEKIY